MAMTVDQVRMTIGDGAINDLALFVEGSPSAITWQLAAVLPDLVEVIFLESPNRMEIACSLSARTAAACTVPNSSHR
jgi:hypothetical protein